MRWGIIDTSVYIDHWERGLHDEALIAVRQAFIVRQSSIELSAFDSSSLQIFRGYYPTGRNFLVTPSGEPAYMKRYGKLDVKICTPAELHP